MPILSKVKKRILLLSGGQSGEHEVSLRSAKSVLEVLPRDQFDVTPVVINKQGRWLSPTETQHALETGQSNHSVQEGDFLLHRVASAEGYDVVFPLLHGPMGEDGTIQGLLTLAGIAFVGSGVLGSAVSMDKVMTKQVLSAVGIPQIRWELTLRHDWQTCPEHVKEQAERLGFPLFVKPANMGSSVGISKVNALAELTPALELAFSLDRRVILEAMTSHKPRELEVGVLGNDKPITSPAGELRFDAEFYDYNTKYTEGEAQMHIPADVPDEVSERLQQLAVQAFKALDCAGLARVDFFYIEETGEIVLNEVNTMPGFTTTSMYPRLLQASGFDYDQLVVRLIELALEER